MDDHTEKDGVSPRDIEIQTPKNENYKYHSTGEAYGQSTRHCLVGKRMPVQHFFCLEHNIHDLAMFCTYAVILLTRFFRIRYSALSWP